MEYDVIISIENNKNNGTIILREEEISLKVKDKCKDIKYEYILAIKQLDEKSVSILLVNKKVVTIQSKKDMNISNIIYNWKSHNNSTIKINSSAFRKTYVITHPITTMLLLLIMFILIYDGLIGVSLSNSSEISPIGAFISGMIFGFAEYPIDLIQIVLFISLAICILLEINYQKKWIKEVEGYFNNIEISTTQHISNEDYSDLEKLKSLLDKNIITEEEFKIKKREILNINKESK